MRGEYLTTAQAAEALSLTDSRVRQLVRSGELPAVVFSPRLQLILVRDVTRRGTGGSDNPKKSPKSR